MDSKIFRKAKVTELQQCAELLQDAFNGYAFFDIYVDDVERRKNFFWSMMKIWMKKTKAFRHMCQVADKACHDLPDPKWHLVLLAVSSHSKGQGIGSKMLHDCILPYIAKNGGGLLTFNTNEEVNRTFYKKNGFEEFDIDTLHENGKEIGNWSYKRMIDAC